MNGAGVEWIATVTDDENQCDSVVKDFFLRVEDGVELRLVSFFSLFAIPLIPLDCQLLINVC